MSRMSDKEDKDLLRIVSGDEALRVLISLVQRDPVIAAVVLQEVKDLLAKSHSVEEVSDDVYGAIGSLEIDECYARVRSQRGGSYLYPAEIAYEMLEEVMDNFATKLHSYRESSFHSSEVEYLKGILLGLYRGENDSLIELSELLDDSFSIYANNLIYAWKKLHPHGDEYTTNLGNFIKESCPLWNSFYEELYWLGK